MIFAYSHLQSFHALYSNCCEFAVTPSMLREVKRERERARNVLFNDALNTFYLR